METLLHRDLKLAYASSAGQTEVNYASFRIDAIGPSDELIEIQHSSLGAIRPKIRRLLDDKKKCCVRIVKPIVARKWIITLERTGGAVLRRRLSPKRGVVSDIFLDLVHFTTLFPHRRLTLEVLLVDAEEQRVPRVDHRFKRKNYTTHGQTLIDVGQRVELKTAFDLWCLLPKVDLPSKFDTAELAAQIERPRWFAQKVAYCMHACGAIRNVGKRGNSQLYSMRQR